MFSQKSLRSKFILQLASASTMLIIIFSVMLYQYIKITIFENTAQNLMNTAREIVSKNFDINSTSLSNFTDFQIQNFANLKKPKFEKIITENGTKLRLFYPSNNQTIVLSQDTTQYTNLVDQILIDILIINLTMIFLILFYALFLSRMLILPVKIISLKLSNLNEKFLQELNLSEFPTEFEPLAKSINRLIGRIHTFTQYQKELFIGIAHELKTPLAVMKTKNEVTLIKQREPEKYIEALKNNNDAINNMNKMINSILEVGRQEGAQFEKPTNKDIVAYLQEIALNFDIIAKGEEKRVIAKLQPSKLIMTFQSTLLLHVVQNFLQNAIKFSPKHSDIELISYVKDDSFVIEVLDSGVGVDESIDLFAPFKRCGDKGGAGLGLFLAKGASEAMGGKISIKNRAKNGSVATLVLPINSKKR